MGAWHRKFVRATENLARGFSSGPELKDGLKAWKQLAVYFTRYDSLTPRERQVMAFVVDGSPNRRIAAQLGTAEITVKVHRASVMKKMKAGSIADLVRIADRIKAGLRFRGFFDLHAGAHGHTQSAARKSSRKHASKHRS